jgi:hypothetical protein
MTTTEYNEWLFQAKVSLSGNYSEEDCFIVLCWFKSIDCVINTDKEIALTGTDVQECLSAIRSAVSPFSMYNDLMMRLWLYAPLILKLEN